GHVDLRDLVGWLVLPGGAHLREEFPGPVRLTERGMGPGQRDHADPGPAGQLDGALERRDRLVPPAELLERLTLPDVAEVPIRGHFEGKVALGDGVLVAAGPGKRPTGRRGRQEAQPV